MKGPIVGLVTIGQSPRVDVVPDMEAILGPAVTVRERGALDGLERTAIAALAPRPGDDILVTRLADGSSVFVAKRHVVARVQAAIGELERGGVTMTALLCTGAFPALEASRLLVLPHQVLLGVLRALRWPGRLGIVTPSVQHVPQTEARWRADGFDPIVVPLSPMATPSRRTMYPARSGARTGFHVSVTALPVTLAFDDEARFRTLLLERVARARAPTA